MVDINHKPSEEMPPSPQESLLEEDLETDNPETLIVAPPTLRERIQAAQRARTLQIQPSVDLPSEDAESDNDTQA